MRFGRTTFAVPVYYPEEEEEIEPVWNDYNHSSFN